MANKQIWSATGRRKRSIAQVRMTGGTGNITVNGVDVNEYMPFATLVMDLKQPLVATNNENRFDIDIKVNGGGFSGQTGAIRLGITRALLAFDANTDQTREDSYRHILKNAGFITRDPRVKERKNTDLKKHVVHHNFLRDKIFTLLMQGFYFILIKNMIYLY
jgi:Ribosomal protein S9